MTSFYLGSMEKFDMYQQPIDNTPNGKLNEQYIILFIPLKSFRAHCYVQAKTLGTQENEISYNLPYIFLYSC